MEIDEEVRFDNQLANGNDLCLSRVLKSILRSSNIERMEGVVENVDEKTISIKIDVFHPVIQSNVPFIITGEKDKLRVNGELVHNLSEFVRKEEKILFDAKCTEIEEGRNVWKITELYSLALGNIKLFDCIKCDCKRFFEHFIKGTNRSLFNEWALTHRKTILEIFRDLNTIDCSENFVNCHHLTYKYIVDQVYEHHSRK